MTLQFFADVDPDGLVQALGSVRAPGPVEAVAGPRPGRLGPHVWTLPVDGLSGLAAAVAVATAPLRSESVVDGDLPFRGHLTLARIRRPEAGRDLPAPELRCRWEVQEILGFRSQLGSGGAVHHVLGRWPLRPG